MGNSLRIAGYDTPPARDAAGGWSRAASLNRIVSMLEGLPADNLLRVGILEAARKLERDCGCAMGSTFLIVTLAATIAWLVAGGELSVMTMSIGAAAILLSSIAGKLTGILIAWLRLHRLVHFTARKLRGGELHVHLH